MGVESWKTGDKGFAKPFDTKKWNKITIRPFRAFGFGSCVCQGLGCLNFIRHGESHGGGQNIHVCLSCCHRQKDGAK